MGVDERDKERIAATKFISVENFIKCIQEYFAPRKTEVRFFEDFSGLQYIRVDNGDGTFAVYEYWTKPTYIDILNKIFRQKNELKIIDVELAGDKLSPSVDVNDAVSEKEFRRIEKKYSIKHSKYAAQWEQNAPSKQAHKKAMEEWDTFWFMKSWICFAHERTKAEE